MTARPGHGTLAALVAGALVVSGSGCSGSQSHAGAGATARSLPGSGGRGLDQKSSFDPRLKPLRCMVLAGLPARLDGPDRIALGDRPGAPSVTFASTFSGAEAAAVSGQAENAEQIGRALLYVRDAGDRELQTIERCLRG